MSNDPFKTRLEIAKKKVSKRNKIDKKHNPSPIGTAFKLSTDLDKTFGTKPWLILIFFFVGVIAGITNVIKSAKNMQK